MDFTVLELHFPNAEFNAPYAKERKSDTDTEADSPPAETDSPSSVLPILFLLIVLGTAAVAYFIRHKQS